MHEPRYTIRWQDRATLGENDLLQCNIDMVLHDEVVGGDVAVIDAKYKAPDQRSNADVAQVLLYAQLRNRPTAFLVYPTRLAGTLAANTAGHRIRSTDFSLEGDLGLTGQRLAEALTATGSRVRYESSGALNLKPTTVIDRCRQLACDPIGRGYFTAHREGFW